MPLNPLKRESARQSEQPAEVESEIKKLEHELQCLRQALRGIEKQEKRILKEIGVDSNEVGDPEIVEQDIGIFELPPSLPTESDQECPSALKHRTFTLADLKR